MQSSELLAAAEALIDHAKAEGADAADATAHAGASHGVTVRLGVLEDIDRSESASVALRVFCGSRSASVSTSDLSRAGLAELASRAVAMARHAPEDPFAGLAPEAALARGPFPDLGIDDGADPSPEELRERAAEAEDAARAVAGVQNSEGGSAQAGRGTSVLVTSTGFAAAYSGTTHALSASVI